MTTQTIPTSGVARRRAKSAARQRWVHELDSLAALKSGRLPIYWDALDMCPCGRVAWLGPDATDEERDEFYRERDEHSAYCDGGLS